MLLRTAGREGEWVYNAGEETKESLSTWPRAAAAQQSSGSERVARERETEGGGKEEEGSGRKGKQVTAGKKNGRASCGPFFQFR